MPDRVAKMHGNGKIASVPGGLRQRLFGLLIGSLPGTWLRDKELVRSHHLSGNKDSGYKANSIAFRNHTFRVPEVNLRLPLCSGVEIGASAGRVETPLWVPRVAGRVQCGGKSETRKIDSGTGRSGTRERETAETPRRACPFHVRSKCAANPNCRTICSARTRYIRWESPRRKSARRKPGSARGATLPLPPGNP